jgi:hypothetical protein
MAWTDRISAWKNVQNYWVMAKVIARVSNYAFGGAELGMYF